MNAHIITIGDEILVGQTVDTNSAYIAKQLKDLGIAITEIQSVKDEKDHIIEALNHGLKKNDIVILTGGLGPTNDDITKKVLTTYFNDELVLYPEVLKNIKAYFEKFQKQMRPVHQQQAMLPKKAEILFNDLGTASGMWFNHQNKIVVSLPGVPYEMKGLLEKVIQKLKTNYQLGDLFHHTILLQGIGETKLADILKDWESENRDKGITVSYLPSVGQVKVRLTGKTDQKDYILKQLEKVKVLLPAYVYGENEDTLEEVVGRLLVKHGASLGTVESCTGGAIASRIVSVPGSSAYYHGSLISYTNTLKHKLVGVDKTLIKQHGAVSQQVVESMAKNGLKKLEVDYCISTSGIAGPTGGTPLKPVGTVWIGIAHKNQVWSKEFHFGHNRNNNIEATVVFALNFLRRKILKLS